MKVIKEIKMTLDEYLELYPLNIKVAEKPEKPKERPCPNCLGFRESAYNISWPGGQLTVSESYHLCKKHLEEWNSYQEQCFF